MLNPDPQLLVPTPVVVCDPDGERVRTVSLIFGQEAMRQVCQQELLHLPAEISVARVLNSAALLAQRRIEDDSDFSVLETPGLLSEDYAPEDVVGTAQASPGRSLLRFPEFFSPCATASRAILLSVEGPAWTVQRPHADTLETLHVVDGISEINDGDLLFVADNAASREARDLRFFPPRPYVADRLYQYHDNELVILPQTSHSAVISPRRAPVSLMTPWEESCSVTIQEAALTLSLEEADALLSGYASDTLINEASHAGMWHAYQERFAELHELPRSTRTFSDWLEALELYFSVRVERGANPRFVRHW